VTSGVAIPLTAHMNGLRDVGRKALVTYVTAGHPDRARSAALLQGLEAAGADCIEVGVPFSDPLADGPVIQRSSQIALEQGMTFDGALEMVRTASLSIPVVLFSYLNPVMNAGADALQRAADAGVSGILITDLPVGADPDREAWLGESPLAGEKESLAGDLPETVARLRGATTLPICVGFGISTPDQAAAVGEMADGVVVGSAIVKLSESSVDAALSLVRSLRAGLDGTVDAAMRT
jgi:tryptophan synthase alpha chain